MTAVAVLVAASRHPALIGPMVVVAAPVESRQGPAAPARPGVGPLVVAASCCCFALLAAVAGRGRRGRPGPRPASGRRGGGGMLLPEAVCD
jgi:hypothetical protein